MSRKRKKKKLPRSAAAERDARASWAPLWAAAAGAVGWTVWTLWCYHAKGVAFEPLTWVGFGGLLGSAGGLLTPGLLWDALLLAGLWLLFAHKGRVLLARIGIDAPAGLEGKVLAAGLGAGTVSLGLLLLGLLRLWRPLLLQVLFYGSLAAVLGAAGLRWYRGRRLGEGETGAEAPAAKYKAGLFQWLAAGLLICAVIINVLAALVPEIFYDSLVYHLALPRLYLLRGAIMATPENLFSGIPFGMQMHFGLALALSGETLAALTHLSFGAGTALALWVWGRRFASRRAGVLAALIFYLSPLTLYASWHCGVDLAASFYGILAFYALCRSLQDGEDSGGAKREENARAWSICAGLLTGFAMSVKYNVFPVGAVLIGVHFWLGRRAGLPVRNTARMALAAFVVLVPWLIKNTVFYGNPLYPFLHGVIGRTAPADWKNFVAAVGSRELGVTFGSWAGFRDVLLFPWTASYANWPMGDWPGPAFIILAPWAIWVRWGVFRREGAVAPVWTGAVLLAVAGYLSWCLASRLVRYVVPALPFIALTAALAVERGPFPLWVRRLGLGAALAACVYDFQVGFRQGKLIGQWKYLREGQPRREYLMKQRTTYGLPYFSAMEFINKNLPADAKVLFLGESRAYYCERDFIAATIFDHNPFWTAARESKSPEELRQKVRAMGVTHVFLSARQLLYRRDAEAVMPKDLIAGKVFGRFWAWYLRPLFEDRIDGGKDPRWLIVYELLEEPDKELKNFPENPARVIYSYLEMNVKPKSGGST